MLRPSVGRSARYQTAWADIVQAGWEDPWRTADQTSPSHSPSSRTLSHSLALSRRLHELHPSAAPPSDGRRRLSLLQRLSKTSASRPAGLRLEFQGALLKLAPARRRWWSKSLTPCMLLRGYGLYRFSADTVDSDSLPTADCAEHNRSDIECRLQFHTSAKRRKEGFLTSKWSNIIPDAVKLGYLIIPVPAEIRVGHQTRYVSISTWMKTRVRQRGTASGRRELSAEEGGRARPPLRACRREEIIEGKVQSANRLLLTYMQ